MVLNLVVNSKGLPKSPFTASGNAEKLEKRLCRKPPEHPTQPTTVGYAAMLATWHVCLSRIGVLEHRKDLKFTKLLEWFCFFGGGNCRM